LIDRIDGMNPLIHHLRTFFAPTWELTKLRPHHSKQHHNIGIMADKNDNAV